MASSRNQRRRGASLSPEVQRLFEGAIELPGDRRADWLQSQTNDPKVLREVNSLLAHDPLAVSFFEEALVSAASSVRLDMELTPGARIGAYAIQRMLARGGMGEVYLATRADGSFEQTVAIKVIHVALADSLGERFQQERQILARLSHPNIARLFDGGETPASLPYFVLEYVPGQEIDRYCDGHGLGLRARLGMFVHVCAAVQYAHENLIVHRDIKPGNIMVGADGTPKLLDFGIAKVLDPGRSGEGAASTRVLTPEYASPEQIRGGVITTAADVYSLGAVLYRLLTGKPPHGVVELSPLEAAREISEQPAPPATGVPADVAAILEKSLHPDLARRYRSVTELSSDIQRFLDGKPVLARPDSMSYRSRRFLRRHWLPASAIAAVVLALAVGATVSLWQARRADRRFAEVRRLSNKFLFEFEEAIHNVAGATKARALLVRTAQEYLDRLAADAGRDRELIRELADAYKKLGDVQGSPVEGNMGDAKASLASYRRALALRDSIGDDQASDAKARISYLRTVGDLSTMEDHSGDPGRSMLLANQAIAIAEKWMNSGAKDAALLTEAAILYANLASRLQTKGEFPAAVTNQKKVLALRQQALDLNPADAKLLRGAALGYWGLAVAEQAAGNPQNAVTGFQKSVDLLTQFASRNARDVSARRELLVASWQLASATKDLLITQKKDVRLVLPMLENTLKLAQKLLRDDPGNALVENDVTSIALLYGSTLQQTGRPVDALAILEPAIASQIKLLNASPENRASAYRLVLLHMWAADSDKDHKNLSAALNRRRAALEIQNRLVASNPNSYNYAHQKAHNLREIGDLLAQRGDRDGASASYRAGLEIAEKLPQGRASLDSTELIAELRASSLRLRGSGRQKPPSAK